ncbi:hypothetical protein HUB98_26310 [Paenibacillus barcinonensis]|uniref:Uncharacterized protein n=1 Tax=Paenibacillus barcinonensis TaxID=198119 RepID=A0A2V4VXN4_PAEBA|nr:hypothetical protein [Paenibacillus barcinonensis]PYE52525.1 hypothetical protein DFQ00_101463 [Paenibacillus barcinonensis]QKS59318.1 hypothetical protein HUB98_26020 [Paenibacillus barcinonensis]QKS59372.1 hypothetical protein HUB98_26310 [Paenibacillus barcinonensis]
MNQNTKDRQRRALRAQLLKTYHQLADAEDVYKQADYRLKILRLEKLLKRVDNPVDNREYTTQGMTVGHCMNCEISVSRYSILKVEDNGSMFCCEGCRVHYDESCGHRKAAASRERNRQSDNFFNSFRSIIPTTQRQIKLG